MPIGFDLKTGKISYEGRVIGNYRVEDGRGKVSLNIQYDCRPDDWVVPLSWFAYGLSHLEQHRPKDHESDLKVETQEEDIGEEVQSLRLLTEKTIRQQGYCWRFHKNDLDDWPSGLHGHDYDKNLTLDAVTGDIYDATTRKKLKSLKQKKLKELQNELRASKDLEDRVVAFLGPRRRN